MLLKSQQTKGIFQRQFRCSNLISLFSTYPILKIFSSFVIVGAIATVLQYVVLLTLVITLDVSPTIASAIGFVASTSANYFLNYHFTFICKKSHKDVILKFLIISMIGLSLNSILMFIGTEILIFHYMLVQIIATITVLFWNFFGNQLWTFSNEKK